ncbi:IS701 family transposase [Streptomyces goshikiensis]
MARIAGGFRRVEPRATARAHLLGVLSGIERKNCWRLAEQAGHARPGPMQRLMRSARWDADAVRDEVRAYAVDRLGGDGGVLIVDETGFLKQPRRALIDRRPYLPERSWRTDPERRQAAGIPDEVRFATKPRLAWEMIAAALDAGVEAPWVTGDEAYGQDPPLRAALEARGTGYVLAVARSIRINSGRTPICADTVAARLPQAAWHRQSAGNCAKGLRYYDWAWIHIGTGEHRRLLIRRNPATRELAFHRAGHPPQCPWVNSFAWPAAPASLVPGQTAALVELAQTPPGNSPAQPLPTPRSQRIDLETVLEY